MADQPTNNALKRSVSENWEANAATWTKLVRAGYDIYRDALHTPAFLEMLPDIKGLNGLDVGCGEGANTRALARAGAKMTGIDIAPTFVHHASEYEEKEPLGIRYLTADALHLSFDDAQFDFASAFMSMMDMPQQGDVLKEVFRILKPQGFFQFTILHPCFVPPFRKNIRDENGKVTAVLVADYFENIDGSLETWLFSSVPQTEREQHKPFNIPRFHRTLSEWIGMINAAGFVLEASVEPMASEELAAREDVVADTRVTPIAWIVRLRKPQN
ncbi:class I SAM-dependent methyltransferase [Pseudochrobactrum lubricantis]|uniref:class I SAM-dependent methyltransferase n=1 Tax=Pseudochrobactrum lubricantis TaxID=558172 RepID=UPI0035E24427